MTMRETIRGPLALALAILLAVLALSASSCSTGTENAGQLLIDSQGSHPAGFATAHPSFAVSNVDQCRSCHGSDLTGGIAKVSCFTAACHHGATPGWATPAVHGASAKRAPGNSGFASCRICHGSDFSRRLGTSPRNCFDCHGVNAPHPPRPWHPPPGVSGLTHTTTDPANAPDCALCHFNEPAYGNHPPVAPPPGSSPGCFNNTLCHGQSAAPHALGAAWRDPSVGGANFHGPAAKSDLTACQSCHSQPGTIAFAGGSATTSCADCHPAARAHPVRWFQAPQPFPGYVTSHRDSGNRNVACAVCHDVTQGRTPPDGAAPSCFSASFNGAGCHANGPGQADHPIDRFLDTRHTAMNTANFPGDCGRCHAVTGTSPVAGAPTCTTCHGEGTTGSIAAKSPLTNGNCTSCHGGVPAKGPNGTPTATAPYPNKAGAHAKHYDVVLPGNASCDSCHAGLGSGSVGHYNRANARTGKNALRVPPGDAAFGATYAAKTAAPGFSNTALTCAGISCHGGQTTPDWQTGTIAVLFDSGPGVTPVSGCRQCHVLGTAQGVPEYNSPFSGLHQRHLEQISSSTGGNALCTECHDMANGSAGAGNHFRFLSTRDLLEGPASDTIDPDDRNPAVPAGTYNAGNQTCTVSCHGVNHTNFSWSGGANHPVDRFLDTRHTTMTAANFAGDCGACHAVSPASPSSSPPTCQTCHQAASPLAAANCTSCHARPPGSSSTSAYPNVEGGHAEHDALGGVTGNCSVCHTGYESGSLAHYDRANARTGKNTLRVPPGDVSIASTYFANPPGTVGAFSNTALTCSNVSCHGGITAPNWQTATINVNVDSGPGVTPVSGCRQCHTLGTASGTPQNNSAWSGLHQKHLQGISGRPGGNALCTECHNMADGVAVPNNHFTNLGTAAMEGPASQTVRPMDKNTAVPAGTYAASTKTCTVTCHTQDHSGWRWEGPGANHPLGAAWTSPAPGFHGPAAKSDLTACQSCHSQPGTIAFAGGSATTSCADCHPAARAHPVRWFQAPQPFPGYVTSHRDSGNRNVACAVCHDVTQGRTPPDGAAPSCFSASFNGAGCHSGGPGAPNHNVPNLESAHFQAVQADFTGNCSNCHSTTGTSPVSAAPNCVACHTRFASFNPLTTKNCTSCHAVPPDNTSTLSTAYPNIARKHARHEALPEVAGVCRTCHNGLDPRTDNASRLAHYGVAKTKVPPGDVSILSAYNSRNATASFLFPNCTSVSCHGGVAANWDTGSINVNTQCTACHQLGNTTAGGSPQFNVYFSGQHKRHVIDRNIACTVCHSTAQLAPVHFNDLSTPAMTQARGTINVTALNFNGAVNPPTCNPNGPGGRGGCHGGETWTQQNLP